MATLAALDRRSLPWKAVRTRAPSSPPSEFPAFCEAVRTWLHDAAGLDPSLAAVADVVARMSGEQAAEEHLANLAADASDMHAVLGATALLTLWTEVG